MKLIFGTYNPSKLGYIRKCLEGLDIEIESLKTMGLELEEAPENEKEPLLNARDKALTYYKQVGKPIFSFDSGLYFENVAEEDQPGTFIKRIHGQDLSGRDMQVFYSQLAAKYGGKLVAYYRNAVCLVMDEDTIYEYDGVELESDKFYMVDTPHADFEEGFPLNSISKEIESGDYYYDVKRQKYKELEDNGFRKFFRRTFDL